MATCPTCGLHGYENDGAFRLESVLVAKKVGEFSLSGAQLKFSAQMKAKLSCTRCGWSVVGTIAADARSFIADQVQPSPALADQGDQLDGGEEA